MSSNILDKSSISRKVVTGLMPTHLPPKVDGTIHYFCKVQISQLHWLASSHYATVVRLRWWGEDGVGSMLRLKDVKDGGKFGSHAVVSYPVSADLDHFTAYMKDMGSLKFEIFTSDTATKPAGLAEIPDIFNLSPGKPVNGTFPFYSSRRKKIAQMRLNISLYPCTDSGDGIISSLDPNINSQTSCKFKDKSLTVDGKADDVGDVDDSNARQSFSHSSKAHGSLGLPAHHFSAMKTSPTAASFVCKAKTFGEVTSTPSAERDEKGGDSTTAKEGDLLAMLLAHGSELRQAMVKSCLTVDDGISTELNLPLLSHRSGSGDMHSGSRTALTRDRLPEMTVADLLEHSDSLPVDLLLDVSPDEDDRQAIGSPGTSVGSDCVDMFSDLGDLFHDDSLLHELFYVKTGSELHSHNAVDKRGDYNSGLTPCLQDVPGNVRPASGKIVKTSCEACQPPSRNQSNTAEAKKLFGRSSANGSSSRNGCPRRRSFSEKGYRYSSKKTDNRIRCFRRSKAMSRTLSLDSVCHPASEGRPAGVGVKAMPPGKGKTLTSRSRSRTRSKRHLSSRGSSSSGRDDVGCTPRSDVSHVSFNPAPPSMDDACNETQIPLAAPVGLTIEQITKFCWVNMATVDIHSFSFCRPDSDASFVSHVSGRSAQHAGKPPAHGRRKNTCTYIVEYQFLMTDNTQEKCISNSMATEMTRAMSKRVSNGVAYFSHHSAFPVLFDGPALERWWTTSLVFTIFVHKAGQRCPSLLGVCGFALKSVLLADDLRLTRDVELREGSCHLSYPLQCCPLNSSRLLEGMPLGVLRVSVGLTSDRDGFADSSRNLRGMVNGDGGGGPVQSFGTSHRYLPSKDTSKMASTSQQIDLPQLAMCTLLMVTEACNLSVHGVPADSLEQRSREQSPMEQSKGSGDVRQTTLNTYLVCRMFWSKGVIKSPICCGDFNPQYNFINIVPVMLSRCLLARMQENYMVVEVWARMPSQGQDTMVGITKLSLHPFYESYHDAKVLAAFLKSEHPVVAVDDCLPLVEPVSGKHFGQLSVLLAMGTVDQVELLRRLKNDAKFSPLLHQPGNNPDGFWPDNLEHNGPDQIMTGLSGGVGATVVRHQLEVEVRRIQRLRLPDSMIWGEADCFVQYFFPDRGQLGLQESCDLHAEVNLRPFRTPTSLCTPDAIFHSSRKHVITLPVGTTLRKELLAACARSASCRDGFLFEVWSRFYHPNTRDQVVARTTLPLDRICAMVAMMNREGESSVQSFTLPLTPVNDTDEQLFTKEGDSGIVDVTVRYTVTKLKTSAVDKAGNSASSQSVILSVVIIRSSGLKDAAESCAARYSGMVLPAEVGVNAYACLRFPVTGDQGSRRTRTVARSFHPEFSHSFELSLHLHDVSCHGDKRSLAQMLENGVADIELWHQARRDIGEGGTRRVGANPESDVLLAVCQVPLSPLLSRDTGIRQWFPLLLPYSALSSQADVPRVTPVDMVGALQVEMQFTGPTDRDRVVMTGRDLGWATSDPTLVCPRRTLSHEDTQRSCRLSVSVDKVAFPISRVVGPGQTDFNSDLKCYVRYKLYDRDVVFSRPAKLVMHGEQLLSALVQHQCAFDFPVDETLLWYLNEEKLEVQSWVTTTLKAKFKRPNRGDILIGTAYVDLMPLAADLHSKRCVSRRLPLYKSGEVSLKGTDVQLSVSAKVSSSRRGTRSADDVWVDDADLEGGEAVDDDLSGDDPGSPDSFHRLDGVFNDVVKEKPPTEATDSDTVTTFSVHLCVERALHLPTVPAAGRSEDVAPSTYVSYQTAGCSTLECSEIVKESRSPVWDHRAEVTLSTDLLTFHHKNLVLKVWHKPKTAPNLPEKSHDRVLGFVSVDLCPLRSGLQQICGWYNVNDFNGQDRGQIKISITPFLSVCGPFGPPPPCMLSAKTLHHIPIETSGVRALSCPAPGVCPAIESNANNSSLFSAWSTPVSTSHPQPPSCPSFHTGDTGLSVDFKSVRRQLEDLDDLTQRLRQRLLRRGSNVDSDLCTDPHDRGVTGDVLGGDSVLSSDRLASDHGQSTHLLSTADHLSTVRDPTVVPEERDVGRRDVRFRAIPEKKTSILDNDFLWPIQLDGNGGSRTRTTNDRECCYSEAFVTDVSSGDIHCESGPLNMADNIPFIENGDRGHVSDVVTMVTPRRINDISMMLGYSGSDNGTSSNAHTLIPGDLFRGHQMFFPDDVSCKFCENCSLLAERDVDGAVVHDGVPITIDSDIRHLHGVALEMGEIREMTTQTPSTSESISDQNFEVGCNREKAGNGAVQVDVKEAMPASSASLPMHPTLETMERCVVPDEACCSCPLPSGLQSGSTCNLAGLQFCGSKRSEQKHGDSLLPALPKGSDVTQITLQSEENTPDDVSSDLVIHNTGLHSQDGLTASDDAVSVCNKGRCRSSAILPKYDANHHRHSSAEIQNDGKCVEKCEMPRNRVPEFFMPHNQLQASLRAVRLATANASLVTSQFQPRVDAKRPSDDVFTLKTGGRTVVPTFSRIASAAKGKSGPTAEEVKRIANIFSNKPT